MYRRAVLLALLLLLSLPFAGAQQPAAAPEDPRVTEFKKLAAQLVERRRAGADESEDLQEKTLKLVDAVVLEQLNRPGPRDLATINRHLAATLAQPGAIGESYELVRLGATATGETHFALVVNFSISGPSAIRYYPPAAQGYRLAGRVDRWEFPDYFDEYTELIPVSASDIVFITVNGRTDELHTGTFSAWHYADGRFTNVWTTDILERSSYEMRPDGFHLSFCSQNDEQNPRLCRRMMNERYLWNSYSWRRVERQESDAPKPPPPAPNREPPSRFMRPRAMLRLYVDLFARTVKT